jgi:hypothetical protein
MTYHADPPADALTRASTIRALVSTFTAAEADTRAAFASLAAHEASLDAAFGAGMGRTIRISATDRDGASDWSPAGAERAVEGMRRAAWQTIVERLELRRMLSIARAAEMGKALESETPPPVTEENVQRFVARWAAALPQMVEEAIAEVFEWLRPREATARAAYKTNEKNARLEIGERVILTWMVERAWRGTGYRLRYGSGASNVGARLTAMENVFSALDGQGAATRGYQSDAQMAIEASQDGKWSTRYFAGTCHRNGNVHLRFLRPDLLAEFNRRAGGRVLRPAA